MTHYMHSNANQYWQEIHNLDPIPEILLIKSGITCFKYSPSRLKSLSQKIDELIVSDWIDNWAENEDKLFIEPFEYKQFKKNFKTNLINLGKFLSKVSLNYKLSIGFDINKISQI